MAYALPRAFIVLVAWGLTCVLIMHAQRHIDPRIFAVVGLPWMLGSTIGFRYLYRWRREAHHQNVRALAMGTRRRPQLAPTTKARFGAFAGRGQALPA
jgi:hypothetical protein